jgi:hypothetical protein
MHRVLAVIALGTALLAGGGAVGSASARPVGDFMASRSADQSALVTPVHADYDRGHYAPPPRYWHDPAPRHSNHAQYERHDHDRYRWRW